MGIIENVWQMALLFFEVFLLLAYLIILFNIFTDIFRDHTLGGGAKAVWVLVLMFVPMLGALIYLIARGKSMQERRAREVKAADGAMKEYIRDAAGRTPAQEIAQARTLLDQGVINEAEFNSLKTKALS